MSKNDSAIVAHARRELEMAGLFNKTAVDDGKFGRGILALVKVLDQYGGEEVAKMDAMVKGFEQVIMGGLLSSPTTNPDEWESVEGAPEGVVRNVRNQFYMSDDNGATWHIIDTKETGKSVSHLKEDANVKPNESSNEGSDTETTPVDTPSETKASVRSEPDATDQHGSTPEGSAGVDESEPGSAPERSGSEAVARSGQHDAVDSQSTESSSSPEEPATEPETSKDQ